MSTTVNELTIDPWPKTREIIGKGYRYSIVMEKMPKCPCCQADELSMLTNILIFCMSCARTFHKQNPKPSWR